MFAQFKTKITRWWQNHINVLPLEQNTTESPLKSKSIILLLPRQCYFETYKTYPLSVGKDIQKVAQVDVLQVSPYASSSSNNTWSSALIHKDEQNQRYIVYYFVLLPKYQTILTEQVALFVVPETAELLLQILKGKQPEKHNTAAIVQENSDGVWLSSPTLQQNANLDISSYRPDFVALKSFFNKDSVDKISNSFTRLKQLKLLFISTVVATSFLVLAEGYLFAMDWYLSNKNNQAKPIVSQLFKVKDSLSLLQQQQQEFAEIHQEMVDTTEPLALIEKYAKDYFLNIKAVSISGNKVTLEATARNANGLLEQLLKSPNVKQAQFKSDIRQVNTSVSEEEFELEFNWEQKLWQTK